MAQAGGVGATLNLDDVHKSSESLLSEVIACSETQERYALFIPTDFTPVVLKIYNEDFDLPHIYSGAGAYVIGHVTDDLRFKLIRGSDVVCDTHVDVITTGIEYDREEAPRVRKSADKPDTSGAPPVRDVFLSLLSSYNVSDKSILFRHYDSEVQGRAVLRPGEADAAVAVFIRGEKTGVAAGIGGDSAIGAVDPYLGGVWAVCEAVRNVACTGGRTLAITDCLNYGDPEQPEVFWEFSEGVRGIGDACRGLKISREGDYGIPVVSGNVSFYNQSEKGQPIAPTPIVAAAGRIEDVSVSKNMGFKSARSKLLLLGELHDRLGGSRYARQFLPGAEFDPPVLDLDRETSMIRSLIDGIESGAVLAAHDISHGGLLITLGEMMLAGAPFSRGCHVDLTGRIPDGGDAAAYLFGEFGGVVVEVDANRWAEFEKRLAADGTQWQPLGETTEDASLVIKWGGEEVNVALADIDSAHRVNGKCNTLFA
jgi:phosphoribosylformylglycinamidine (FGAM) synthase-like enzyme